MSTLPRPADFCLVRSFGPAALVISAMEKAAGPRSLSQYTHALVYAGGPQWDVVEAEYPRIRCRSLAFRGRPLFTRADQLTLWSAGCFDLTDAERKVITERALFYAGDCQPGKGVEYSGLDYLAIAEHRAHLPDLPWHRRDGRWLSATQIMADTAHMICSQVVVQCYLDAGVILLPGHLPGNDMPSDLALLVSTARARGAPYHLPRAEPLIPLCCRRDTW